MQKKSDFQRVAAYLFKPMGLNQDPTDEASEGYTVTLDNQLQIHLIGAQPEFMSMLCVVGTLLQRSSAPTLTKMLYANQFSLAHPVVSLGVDQKTQEITVWTRERLKELDEKNALALYNRFVDMTNLLKNWLDKGGATTSTKTTGSSDATVQRLTRTGLIKGRQY